MPSWLPSRHVKDDGKENTKGDEGRSGKILGIYAAARSFMASCGNPTQWGTEYPPKDLVEEDIKARRLFACEGRTGSSTVFSRSSSESIPPMGISNRDHGLTNRLTGRSTGSRVTASCPVSWHPASLSAKNKYPRSGRTRIGTTSPCNICLQRTDSSGAASSTRMTVHPASPISVPSDRRPYRVCVARASMHFQFLQFRRQADLVEMRVDLSPIRRMEAVEIVLDFLLNLFERWFRYASFPVFHLLQEHRCTGCVGVGFHLEEVTLGKRMKEGVFLSRYHRLVGKRDQVSEFRSRGIGEPVYLLDPGIGRFFERIEIFIVGTYDPRSSFAASL